MTPRTGCDNPSNFRFYLYEVEEVRQAVDWRGDDLVSESEPASALFEVLSRHPYRTLDPEAACVFVARVDTLCAYNMCRMAPSATTRLLSSLPYWRGDGRDHIVFNFNDMQLTFDVGSAMLVKSSFGWPLDLEELAANVGSWVDPSDLTNLEPYVPGYDVVFPLAVFHCGEQPTLHLHRFENFTLAPPQVGVGLVWCWDGTGERGIAIPDAGRCLFWLPLAICTALAGGETSLAECWERGFPVLKGPVSCLCARFFFPHRGAPCC